MRHSRCFLILVAVIALEAAAQDAPPETGSASEEAPETQVRAAEGDVIILNDGRRLAGVQVVRKTVQEYEIEIVPGVEYLKLPLKFVERVEYDDIEVDRNARRGREGDDNRAMMHGQELAPELHQKLNKTLSPGPDLQFDRQDFVEILKKLGQAAGVEIGFGEAVLAMEAEQRMWEFRLEEDSTLILILRDRFLRQWPMLQLQFKYDKLAVTAKAASGAPSETAQ